MSILSLKGIGFSYGKGEKILQGLDYEFEGGKVYAITGRSGAGKTTLLSLLSGLTSPGEGVILFKGKDIRESDRYRYRSRYVGVIFQQFNLLPHLTAVENVELSMRASGKTIRDKRKAALLLLEKVGLDERLACRRILKLSGGEQQRVAIARAIVRRPALILADEPTGALDLETGASVMGLLDEIAAETGADAIAHGATGKGNDQIRFELGIKSLAPDLKIIAAWRNDKWTLDSRESEIEYCKQHGIHLPFSADSSYSRDRNLWHISHEGLELEDPALMPNYDHLLVLSVTPQKAPDEVTYVTMTFEQGVPKTLNGEAMSVANIIRKLNKLGGENGIGIIDIVENRVVGMKSRGVYETPGGTILMEAHQQLEELILDRETYELKDEIGHKFASLVYEGKWFSPLREAEQAFIESTQKYVTGEVKLGLYKGNIIKAGTTSPYSLYSESLASFTTGDLYDHHDAEGFITLFGLSTKVRAMKMQEAGLL